LTPYYAAQIRFRIQKIIGIFKTFPQFLTKKAQIWRKEVKLRPRDQLGLDTLALLNQKIYLIAMEVFKKYSKGIAFKNDFKKSS
jgi:hypothetical protein